MLIYIEVTSSFCVNLLSFGYEVSFLVICLNVYSFICIEIYLPLARPGSYSI